MFRFVSILYVRRSHCAFIITVVLRVLQINGEGDKNSKKLLQ